MSNSKLFGSPLSPLRHNIFTENADLKGLNDRLASLIDRVSHLETENSRLTLERALEVSTLRETVTREISNIKSMYENELSYARKLLDETAREKAQLEIDKKRLCEENDDLTRKLTKQTKMSDSEEVVVEKKRGRPAAADKSKPVVEAKKPKKVEEEKKKSPEKSPENGNSPAKRGRGRPPGTKKAAKAKKAPVPGRGRGRPKAGGKAKDSSEDEEEKSDDPSASDDE